MIEKEYLDNYQKWVISKLNPKFNKTKEDRFLNGVLGLSGEAGEVADYYKKIIFQGHEPNCDYVLNECGDLLFYIAETLESHGFSLYDAFEANKIKLNKRYKGAATIEESINRIE